jgi:hypothetical protein
MDKDDFTISLDIITVEILLKCILDDMQKKDIYRASIIDNAFERITNIIENLTGDVYNLTHETSFAKLKTFVFELAKGYPAEELIGSSAIYGGIDNILNELKYDELKKDGIID